jgi:hypothetical protein
MDRLPSRSRANSDIDQNKYEYPINVMQDNPPENQTFSQTYRNFPRL